MKLLLAIGLTLALALPCWAQGYNNGGYGGGGGGSAGGGITGGTCTGGQFMSGISVSGVPTCATPAGGGGAPLTNPVGGANNYAPITSPTFAGGMAYTNNQNASTSFIMTNTDPGGSSATSSQFNNGTATDSFGLTGTGYTAGGATLPANAYYLYNAAAGGVVFWNNGAGPTVFWNGGTKTGTFGTTGLDVAALTIGGTALGGSCTGLMFVKTISAAGVPTCASPTGAPINNPAGGQNNYAPLASPTFTGTVTASIFIGNGTPSVSGGGALVTGSNSVSGVITGLVATGNILTPGFTCPHFVVGGFMDTAPTPATITLTNQSNTTLTFSATAGHSVAYFAMSCI
jgi:hypothetical protein